MILLNSDKTEEQELVLNSVVGYSSVFYKPCVPIGKSFFAEQEAYETVLVRLLYVHILM